MNAIKYHQNGLGNEYGTDHTLTNNWNPDFNYEKEYVNIHFRIEPHGYGYPEFSFTEENEKAFYAEVKNALQSLGWETETDKGEWHCEYIKKGKQHLYLHPQDFSGEILKNEVGQIAEALRKHNTFYLRWVDLYDTVYDISDGEYDDYLKSKETEIRKALFNNFTTTRASKFYYVFDVCRSLADIFKLRRVGLLDDGYGELGQTVKFIEKIVDSMIQEGLLIGTENKEGKLVRSLNKTEKRKSKVNVA